MGDVATIHGGHIPGSADEGVVGELERLLADAKAGTLIAFGYATVGLDNFQATGWAGASGTRHPLGTAIDILQQRYVWAQWNGGMK